MLISSLVKKHLMRIVNIAKIFFKEIVRLHGIARIITSDHDTKFMSCFWKEIQNRLSTELGLSTTYHPQMDRQIEVVN